MSTLGAAADVAMIIGGVGVIPSCLWVGGRLRRANQADTEAAVEKKLLPARGDIAKVSQRLTVIEAQFRNNGGSTLRDKVDETGRSVAGLSGRVDEHLRQSEDDRRRLGVLEQAFINLHRP